MRFYGRSVTGHNLSAGGQISGRRYDPSPFPFQCLLLFLLNDPPKERTWVTSSIDLKNLLTSLWSPCTSLSKASSILVCSSVSLSRSSCFCLAFNCYCWCNKNPRIISRQSTCLPLYSSSIKLVQSITWVYWLPCSAAERAVCKINALFSPRLALLMLVFMPVKMRGKQGRSHLLPLYFISSTDFGDTCLWVHEPLFFLSAVSFTPLKNSPAWINHFWWFFWLVSCLFLVLLHFEVLCVTWGSQALYYLLLILKKGFNDA